MKNNKRNDYSYFKSKIFLRGLGVAVLSCMGVGVLYSLFWQDKGGDWVVTVIHDLFRVDWATAQNLYNQIFRQYQQYYWVIAIILVFFVLFSFFLSWFTRYFQQIDKGIDALLEEKEISLPPEMSVIEGKIKTARQILDRRAMDAQRAEQQKNDLVMYLAHDIRTPLTSVIGYLSLLDEAKDMPPEQKEKYIHITLDKAYRLEKLVNEFFEITRYNLQQIQLEKEPIDLYYMLVQMADEFYPILSAKGITAVLQADENLTVYGDPMKLARVFNNILKNAAAYSYPDTQIIISADKEDDFITITFQNQGATIPQDKLNTVFEKFYRMDEARLSDTGGAGLGLAIAKEIVTIHGGTIAAQSTSNLTTFTVKLPAERSTQ